MFPRRFWTGDRNLDSADTLPPIRIYPSKTFVESARHDGGSTCRGRVGEGFCAYLWCPARFTCRPRPRARNPFACTRSGGQMQPKKRTISRTRYKDEIAQTALRRDTTQASTRKRRIRPAQQLGSRYGLTILAPGRRSKRKRSSKVTNTNAANSSRSPLRN